jgi:hypothetical protein
MRAKWQVIFYCPLCWSICVLHGIGVVVLLRNSCMALGSEISNISPCLIVQLILCVLVFGSEISNIPPLLSDEVVYANFWPAYYLELLATKTERILATPPVVVF